MRGGVSRCIVDSSAHGRSIARDRRTGARYTEIMREDLCFYCRRPHKPMCKRADYFYASPDEIRHFHGEPEISEEHPITDDEMEIYMRTIFGKPPVEVEP